MRLIEAITASKTDIAQQFYNGYNVKIERDLEVWPIRYDIYIQTGDQEPKIEDRVDDLELADRIASIFQDYRKDGWEPVLEEKK